MKRKMNIEDEENKPKQSFEKMMKKILDQGNMAGQMTSNKMSFSDSKQKDDLFKGDSLKLYKYFLNKLLTKSSDPFFTKKHRAYLISANLVASGPDFYERMNHDVSQRRNKDTHSSTQE